MDRRRPFPGKRTFIRSESEDADEELGRSLKRIRLDGSSHTNSEGNDDDHDYCSNKPMIQQCQPSPGELCVQRDLQHALANHLLQPNSQSGVYSFQNGVGTLTQVTSTRFLFAFESRWARIVTVSLTIPKRYPHQPPSLSIVSAATIFEQHCFSRMIAVSPTLSSSESSSNSIMWSPVHRLTDVLGWILQFTMVPTEQQPSVAPRRLSHPFMRR